jgi:hypothetical protein
VGFKRIRLLLCWDSLLGTGRSRKGRSNVETIRSELENRTCDAEPLCRLCFLSQQNTALPRDLLRSAVSRTG